LTLNYDEWDKLWEDYEEYKLKYPNESLYWLNLVKAEGDKLKEDLHETRFLLNCESEMHKECRLQLGKNMKKLEAIRQLIKEHIEQQEFDPDWGWSYIPIYKLEEILEA